MRPVDKYQPGQCDPYKKQDYQYTLAYTYCQVTFGVGRNCLRE